MGDGGGASSAFLPVSCPSDGEGGAAARGVSLAGVRRPGSRARSEVGLGTRPPWRHAATPARVKRVGRGRPPSRPAAVRPVGPRASSSRGWAERPGVCSGPSEDAGWWRLDVSLDWPDRLPTDFPGYLAVQDGVNDADVHEALGWALEEWGCIGGLFVGGSVEWTTLSAPTRVRLAHGRGMRCHVGRVGSLRRPVWADLIGADPAGSTSICRNNRHGLVEKAPGEAERVREEGGEDAWRHIRSGPERASPMRRRFACGPTGRSSPLQLRSRP